MFLAILLPKSKFCLSLASSLCFVLTSPQCYGIKLRTFSVRLILAGSKELSWMIFPNDIMARLTAMFHAAFCESKLLAQRGYQTLTKSTRTLRRLRAPLYTHTQRDTCPRAPFQTSVSTIPLFTCF